MVMPHQGGQGAAIIKQPHLDWLGEHAVQPYRHEEHGLIRREGVWPVRRDRRTKRCIRARYPRQFDQQPTAVDLAKVDERFAVSSDLFDAGDNIGKLRQTIPHTGGRYP